MPPTPPPAVDPSLPATAAPAQDPPLPVAGGLSRAWTVGLWVAGGAVLLGAGLAWRHHHQAVVREYLAHRDRRIEMIRADLQRDLPAGPRKQLELTLAEYRRDLEYHKLFGKFRRPYVA